MHYEVPNLSSSKLRELTIIVLYDYTNKEYDIIKNAFRIGNWDSIRDLPYDLKPYSVQQHIARRL